MANKFLRKSQFKKNEYIINILGGIFRLQPSIKKEINKEKKVKIHPKEEIKLSKL